MVKYLLKPVKNGQIPNWLQDQNCHVGNVWILKLPWNNTARILLNKKEGLFLPRLDLCNAFSEITPHTMYSVEKQVPEAGEFSTNFTPSAKTGYFCTKILSLNSVQESYVRIVQYSSLEDSYLWKWPYNQKKLINFCSSSSSYSKVKKIRNFQHF